MKRLGTAILLGGLVAAAPAGAQTHDHQHGRAQAEQQAGEHQHGADCAMMAAHRTAPKMLLKHGDMLQLTAAQVQQLEALQATHKADCERRMAAVRAAEAAASVALAQATADLGTYEAKLREAAGHKVDCKVDMARLSQAGAALLTDAQKAHMSHMQHGAH